MSGELSIHDKAQLLLSIAEDVQGGERLEEMLTKKPNFIAYNGFEPSGRMHIAQALITAINTNVITKCGGTMILYIADYFAQLNHKMGGDLAKIRDVGQYFIEVFKACGMDMEHVQIIWTSDFIREHQREYFNTVMDIATFATLSRVKRTCQIMGRKEGDNLSVSQLLYPCMQVTDVLMLGGGVDIAQLGVDQRKVNMLAIEYAARHNLKAPIILSHHMLMGLKGKANKMSKSDPDSAIFIEDQRDAIFQKIHKAACPPEADDNPLFEYVKYIILRRNESFTIGDKTYTNSDEIKADFAEILKNEAVFRDAVADAVDKLIQPIRDHFNSPELQELLAKISSYRTTR